MTIFLIIISVICLFANGYFDKKIKDHILNETEKNYLIERCKGRLNFGLSVMAPNSSLTSKGILFKRLAWLSIIIFAVIVIFGSLYTFIYDIK